LTSVAQVVAQALAGAGVRWAFTVPGESFLGLLDALPQAGITVIATRHEGGAAFMAEAVGQLTGKPAAVLGTRAVGAANMSIGIHAARQNSTPLIALLGQVQRDHLGREAFQEVDLVASFGRLAKWSAQLDDPGDAASVVGEGLSAMLSGRPGPVLLALPEDVIDLDVPDSRVSVTVATPARPSLQNARVIVDMLASADRPAILAGGGVIASGARDSLVAFSERLAVPVFAAWRRPSAFPNDHPNYLGTTGYGCAATVRPRLQAADALLVVGCRLNEIASFDYALPAPTTRWAHVDLEPRTAHAGLGAPDVALVADAKAFLDVANQLPVEAHSASRAIALAAERSAFLAATTMPPADSRPAGVDPAHVVRVLQQVLDPDAIVTSDAGNFGLWLARYFRFGARMSFLGPTSGAMGCGLPAAIAASLVESERQVIALCGDGGMAMTMNELETAVRTRAKPVVLVFDNERYGTIAMHQANEQRSPVATELGPVDFAAIARACAADGVRITDNAAFEPALRTALASGRPTVLHLEVDPGWVSPGPSDARLTDTSRHVE
jgi:acetolactate synthase-1/2/3 large subunit